eukprot:CAMPEP_0172546642 /NCGR_PEP_ID=MMETSP1067-20121228/16347_1 /TAXON_ID=265564 ORGANISM="Thalassiosira punctigera, Strain Tpunct2005C2" /NCGR_SAMPLE_ID=MMETSP1067 /ASSEMBLY_ACC=CAM_ASM_000444 /LENGTH=419 /DNA_ID=CAMNT_0013333605 /DNA_START=123 /DNA_END=1382 /DNA_ORIENTATION=+
MKITTIALFSSLVVSSDARGFRNLVEKVTRRNSAPATETAAAEDEAGVEGAAEGTADQENRQLNNGCWKSGETAKWHPTYSAGWTSGYCRLTVDCNSPSYGSELACCKGAYRGQNSGTCLSRLPSPPTMSPTDTGGLDVYYPDYNKAWPLGECVNTRPMPSGRPTYTTQLACCKGAYAGQMSGHCLAQLPSPPTMTPTNSLREADFWYPDYDTNYADAGCSNKLPLPFNNKNDRPNYETQIACCKGAYAGQTSGKCLSQLPSPPTTSPTDTGGYDFWYPDYDTNYAAATCKNERPLPYGPGGRPTFDSQLACCKAAYAGQTSGACLAGLASPPTTAPTESGGLDVYYPDYSRQFAGGICINDRPLPSGRPSYTSKAACCSAAYSGQNSHACMCDINICNSCKCASETALAAANCGLTCS